MGNIGMPELIFIMVLALLIFGPKKLPEMGKQIGKALGEFKRASNDLKRSIEDEVEKATRETPGPDPPKADPPSLPAPEGTVAQGETAGEVERSGPAATMNADSSGGKATSDPPAPSGPESGGPASA